MKKTKHGYTATTTDIKNIFKIGIYIPDFQRNFVWDKKRQVQLIHSIINSLPIGAITLFEQNDMQGKYLIVDGLQRLTTIDIFMKNPNKIFDTKSKRLELGRKSIDNCYKLLINNAVELKPGQIEILYNEWFKSLQKPGDQNRFISFVKNTSVKDIIDDDDIKEEVYQIFRESVDIDNYELPIISYSGEREALTGMFERLNKNGIVLSKYDVYHATWNDFSIVLDDLMITVLENEITSRKKTSRFEIENSNSNFIPLYYNFLTLNRRIANVNGFDKVFPKLVKVDNIPNIQYNKQMKKQDFSFELYSSILQEKPNTIDKVINDIFTNCTNSEQQINMFLNKLNRCIILSAEEVIDEIIAYLVDSKIEIKDNVISKYHFYYLVCCNIHLYYHINVDKLEINELKKSNGIDSMKKTLFDIKSQIQKRWFRDENRQISFFVGKIREFKQNTLLSDAQVVNIDSNGSLIESKMHNCDVKKVVEALENFGCEVHNVDPNNDRYFINGNTFELIQLQDVNNEPYNKRIQGARIKRCVEESINILGYYPIEDKSDVNILFSLWRVKDIINSNDMINSMINPSLKINVVSLKKIYDGYDYMNFDDYKYSSFIFTLDVACKVFDKDSTIIDEFLSKNFIDSDYDSEDE